LIELLVVISVIAMLMGILVPVLSKARAIVKRTSCQSNLRQLGMAFRVYLDDNNNIMPKACRMLSVTTTEDPAITDLLLPLISEEKVFRCPSDTVKKYYIEEKTSYEYNSFLAGQAVSQSFMAKRLNLNERNIQILYDFEPFHGKAGTVGAKNYLYADCHVGNLKDQ